MEKVCQPQKSCWKYEKLLKPQYQKFINTVCRFYSGSYLELVITFAEGTKTGFRVPSIVQDLSFTHSLSTHGRVFPFKQVKQ